MKEISAAFIGLLAGVSLLVLLESRHRECAGADSPLATVPNMAGAGFSADAQIALPQPAMQMNPENESLSIGVQRLTASKVAAIAKPIVRAPRRPAPFKGLFMRGA